MKQLLPPSEQKALLRIADDDDDFSAFGQDDDSSTDEVSMEEKGSVNEARRDIKLMNVVRAIVILFLLTVACIGSEVAFVAAVLAQERSFQNSYYEAAELLTEQFYSHIHDDLWLSKTLATQLVQSATTNWPYVTYSDFAAICEGPLHLSDANMIHWTPVVANKEAWENYTSVTYPDNLDQADIASDNEESSSVSYHVSDTLKLHGFSQGMLFKVEPKESYFPIWQSSPSFDQGMGTCFEEATNPVRNASLTEVMRREGSYLSRMFFNDTSQGDLAIYSTPRTMIYYPIMEADDAVVGVVNFEFEFSSFFKNALDDNDYDSAIHAVVKNTCDENMYTFSIVGSSAKFLGVGDKHNLNDGFEVRSIAPEGYLALLEEHGKLPMDETCFYQIKLYPSKDFKESFNTWGPDIYRAILLGAFLCIIGVFLAYDKLIERHQKNVIGAAERSDAIVRSLFPANIRDKLYEKAKKKEEEKKQRQKHASSFNGNDSGSVGSGSAGKGALIVTNKNKLKNFVNDGGRSGFQNAFEDDPIADLFPQTTILFADIAGFTAWSSEREPSQVFTLLENIYAVMDKLAKKNNVFKVETVGDCYVAATGLPDPQEQHAVIMVRFAQICLLKIRELVLALESQLGPGTADLAMRAGIHSGPVTAGVLRGQKARFQLFGDTMNTAARMESNGAPHKVHISSDTYECLKQSGKAHWAVPREELVHAKGKGSVQTYWVRSMAEASSAASSSDDMNGNVRRVSTLLTTTKPWEGTYLEQYFGLTEVGDALERLVNWNSDLLASLLKSVVASRVAAGRPASAPVTAERKVAGELVLDEIEMVIKVPEFDATAAEEIDHVLAKVQLPEFVKNELLDFVACIASGYMLNPFHNFEHASHVILSSNKLLKRIMSLDNHKNNSTGEAITSQDLYEHTYGIGTDPLTQFAIVFSALIHDVGHVGVPNFVLAEENPNLAERYIQKSIAEQHSVTVAWDLLMQPHFRNLRSYIYTTEEECVRFRQLLVNMVMATDIFDPDLKALRASRWEMAFGDESGTDIALNIDRKATIVIEHVIQASDVSHTMQHWYIYKKWNERLFEEMYTAYAEGRTKKDPSDGWYGGEIWFFDNYVIPLATKLKKCGVFGFSSEEYLNYATQNRMEWEAKGQEVVEAMREKVIAKLALKNEAPNEDIPMEITMSSETESRPTLESVPESAEETTETTEVHLRTVVAPAGKLRVVIDTTPGQMTLVHQVLDNSPMTGLIRPGDQIVSIDGIPTSNMSTEAIAALLKSTADHPRRFVIRSDNA